MAKLSSFGLYCPVAWHKSKEFIKGNPESLTHVVRYAGHYYLLGSAENLRAFTAAPSLFLATPPPTVYPAAISSMEVKSRFPAALELNGCCPVSFKRGQYAYEALVHGSPDCVAEYCTKLYAMADPIALAAFLRSPLTFSQGPTPTKYPPLVLPLNLGTLPMLGYMEQTVAQVITKAMTAVSLFRPQYPFLSATASAQTFVALFIKANNPKSSDRVRALWRQRLKKFEDKCSLVTFLGNEMLEKVSDPRVIDLDFKLKSFNAMRR